MLSFMNITKALSDENRIRILMALNGHGELCVCQLIDMLQLAPSTVSKHLLILRNARLITGRKEGRWTHYRLNTAGGPLAAVEALDWVIRSVAEDQLVKQDEKRVRAILADDQSTRCAI